MMSSFPAIQLIRSASQFVQESFALSAELFGIISMYQPDELKRHHTRLLLKAVGATGLLIWGVYLYRGTFWGDPVFDRSLSRTNGDVVAALKDVGTVRENSKGEIESISLMKTVSRRRLPSLRHNNVVLEYMKEVRSIKSLGISALCNIDDRGMKHVGEMTQLESLNLNGLPITNSGLRELHHLKRLKTLSLYVTKITPDGIKRFQRAVPGCSVSHGSRMPK